jgi:hypothetical protein
LLLPRLQQRERQRERDGGVQTDDHQRLTQVFGLALPRIHRRVGYAQNLRRDGRIESEDLGDSGHIGFGVVRKPDDLRRDTRRSRQVLAALELLA